MDETCPPIESEIPTRNDAVKDQEHTRKLIWLLSVFGLAAVAAFVALGVCLGVRNDSDCNKSYDIKLVINQTGPFIQTSDSSYTYLSGVSSTSWAVNHMDRGYHATMGWYDGWFERAIRVTHVNDKQMSLNVRFHNQMEMSEYVDHLVPFGDVTTSCDPPMSRVDVHGVAIGGESNEFELGECRITRQEGQNYPEPAEIRVAFTGKILVERI